MNYATVRCLHNGDRFGWVESDDSDGHLTLRIPACRMVDDALDGLGEPVCYLSGQRAIAELLAADGNAAEFWMTPN